MKQLGTVWWFVGFLGEWSLTPLWVSPNFWLTIAATSPHFSGHHREEVSTATTTPQVQEQQQRYIKRHPYLPNDASNFLHGDKVKPEELTLENVMRIQPNPIMK